MFHYDVKPWHPCYTSVEIHKGLITVRLCNASSLNTLISTSCSQIFANHRMMLYLPESTKFFSYKDKGVAYCTAIIKRLDIIAGLRLVFFHLEQNQKLVRRFDCVNATHTHLNSNRKHAKSASTACTFCRDRNRLDIQQIPPVEITTMSHKGSPGNQEGAFEFWAVLLYMNIFLRFRVISQKIVAVPLGL